MELSISKVAALVENCEPYRRFRNECGGYIAAVMLIGDGYSVGLESYKIDGGSATIDVDIEDNHASVHLNHCLFNEPDVIMILCEICNEVIMELKLTDRSVVNN